jgi:hypothetical protein
VKAFLKNNRKKLLSQKNSTITDFILLTKPDSCMAINIRGYKKWMLSTAFNCHLLYVETPLQLNVRFEISDTGID